MTLRVVWRSSFGLKESTTSNDQWDVSVTGFNDNTIHIDIVQPGNDVHKEFVSVVGAYDWLMDFSAGRALELSPSCKFDFRTIVF